MNLKIFALYDKKASKFVAPQEEENIEMYKRQIYPFVNSPNPNSNLANFPEDFDMYELADFDPHTGVITSHVEFIQNCRSLKKVEVE